MKKILALVLALVLVLGLVACGETAQPATEEKPAEQTAEQPAEAAAMKVAMITDYGDITDQSFNQTTYEACKSFCEGNSLDFNYFKPVSDSDADRIAMIETAIDGGFNVIVMPGYAFGNAIKATVGT